MAQICRQASTLAFLLYAFCGAGSSLRVKQCRLDFMRLPKSVQPTHYKIEIQADPNAAKFRGEVEIDVKLDQNRKDVLCESWRTRNQRQQHQFDPPLACDRTKIILSVDDSLKIHEVEYWESESGLSIPVSGVCRDAKNDLLVVELSREPEFRSSGTLVFVYSGQVRTDFTGLFRDEFEDEQTQKRKRMVATQFESAHARKVFPSFDEPEFKATFELILEHPKHLRALANTRPLRSLPFFSDVDGVERIRTYFAQTPRMSSYLLAFAVGEFDQIQASLEGYNMTLSLYVPPGRANEAAHWSLGAALRSYTALQDFFDIGQPIEKMDLVSCKEFPGAMENWGMITFEQETLVPSNMTSYEASQMHFAHITMIHELAHQWFGNLVTMKWWDDLWLNEGFASWISYELTEKLYPKLGSKYMYLLESVLTALDMDSDVSLTHPIKNSALQTVDEIEESFDTITYEKASAIIRMLKDFIGEEKFKWGIRDYMRANKFGNTDDSDLWRSLSNTSGLDVKSIMRSWIQQEGYPLIQVELISKLPMSAASASKTIRLRQTRFLSAQSDSDKVEKRQQQQQQQTQKWTVPVSMWVSNGADRVEKVKFVLRKSNDEIELPAWFDIEKPGHWVKLNADFEGFYRVKYETPELWRALRGPIETKSMSPSDRIQLIEETTGLYMAGHIDESQVSELLSWYANEDYDAVVAMICTTMKILATEYNPQDSKSLFKILIRFYEKTGRMNETTSGASLINRLARANAISRLVWANYEPVVRDALELFDKTNGQVPEFALNEIYWSVVKYGTDEQFQLVVSRMKQIKSDRMRRLTAKVVKSAVRDNSQLKIIKSLT